MKQDGGDPAPHLSPLPLQRLDALLAVELVSNRVQALRAQRGGRGNSQVTWSLKELRVAGREWGRGPAHVRRTAWCLGRALRAPARAGRRQPHYRQALTRACDGAQVAPRRRADLVPASLPAPSRTPVAGARCLRRDTAAAYFGRSGQLHGGGASYLCMKRQLPQQNSPTKLTPLTRQPRHTTPPPAAASAAAAPAPFRTAASAPVPAGRSPAARAARRPHPPPRRRARASARLPARAPARPLPAPARVSA